PPTRSSSGRHHYQTYVSSEPHAYRGDRAASMAAGSASPVDTSVIAKCPRSRVIVESVRLRPSPARILDTSATMPGRSCPTTVTASSATAAVYGYPGRPGTAAASIAAVATGARRAGSGTGDACGAAPTEAAQR